MHEIKLGYAPKISRYCGKNEHRDLIYIKDICICIVYRISTYESEMH